LLSSISTTASTTANDSSNYTRTASNILFNDYVYRDSQLNTALLSSISTTASTTANNSSNYTRTASNILFNDYVYRDSELNTTLSSAITTSARNVSNYVDINKLTAGNNISIGADKKISVNLISYTGDATINGNLTVCSNLTVDGTTTYLNTDVYTTEKLNVTNAGSGPALTITQTSQTNNIMNISNYNSEVFNIANNGTIRTNNNNINAGSGTITAATFSGNATTATTATNAQGLTGNPNISVGTITTNNNNINAGSGTITATTFSGNATTATTATTATNAQGLTGNPNISVGTITTNNNNINAGSGTITATTFSGNATTATTATNAQGLTGNPNISVGTITTNNNNINAGSGTITATTFSGNATTATTATNAQGLTGNPNISVGTITTINNVGIGITNPHTQNSLHVHKTGAAQFVKIALTDDTTTGNANRGLQIIKETDQTGFIYNYENKDLAFGTNAIEKMRILATGNIGIGTTAPQGLLHLHKTATIQDVRMQLTDGTTTGNTNRGLLLVKATDNHGYLINGEDNKDLVFVTYVTEKMRILSNGNIGIGTSAPQSVLHLHKTATAQDVRIALTDGTSTGATNRGVHFVKGSDNVAYLYNYENTALIFGTNGGEKMRILATGNVGIGTTNPQRSLHVQTAMRIGGSGAVIDFGDDMTNQIYRNGTTNELRFTTAATDRLVINPSGNIGIGTNVPQHLLSLHVNNTTDTSRITFTNNNTGTGFNNGFMIGLHSTKDVFIWNNENSAIQFGTSGAERMRILGTGNIGIGTTNPQTKLDVDGNLLIRAYGTTGSGTKGIFFRPDFVTTNQYNCSILTYDHSLGGENDGLSINGYDGVSFCTGSGSRQERMIILQNGNIGIGTTNPGCKLDIQGGAAQTLRILDTRATGDAIIALKEFNDNNGFDMAYIGATDDRFYIRGYNNSSTPRVDLAIDRITSNVGIGMTNPKYKLDVAGTINASNILINGATVTANSMQWITSSSDVYTSNLSGNVGIGTSSPLKKMHILQTHNSGGVVNTTSLDITEADLIVSSMSSHTTKKDTGIMFFANGSASANISYASAFIKSGWATAGSVEWNKSYLDFNTHSGNNTTWTTDMRIQGGNVGIGMTNPMYKLDVAGTINASNILINGSLISASSTQWITSGANIYANNLLGNVGIGTTNPTAYKLTVNGTIGASGNITASYSDERLKTITEYVSDVLPILNKIRVFKYNCNDIAASYGYDKNKKEIGLSAQEIQKYYPEVVSLAPFDIVCENENINSKSGENYLTLDYVRLVPVLLQGIKDLNNVTTSQQNTITDLEERLARLEKIINN
jgi:hypothetical protein